MPLYVYMYYILFIDSSVNGHLCCFHFLAIVSNVALNTGAQILVQLPAFNSFVYISGNGIIGSYGNCMFICFP